MDVRRMERQALDAIEHGIRENRPHYQISAHEAYFGLSIKPSANHLIVCQPKSASTFTANVLADILGLPVMEYSGYGTDPNTVSVEKFAEVSPIPAVIHQHTLADRKEIGLFRAAKLRPVVLIRDVADAILSYADHRKRHAATKSRDAHFNGLPAPDQLMVATMERAAWFVRFQVGWYAAASNDFIPMKLFHYDQLTADPVWAAGEILRHWGLKSDPGRIEAAVARVSADAGMSNRGIGRAGAGAGLPNGLRDGIAALFEQEGISESMIRDVCEKP